MTDRDFFGPDADSVFEAWNRRGFAARCDLLAAALTQLPPSTDLAEQSRLLPGLLDHARQQEQALMLPGPTGESNELYLSARGLTLVLGSAGATPLALAGQLFTALACGNPVLFSAGAEAAWGAQLVSLLHRIGVPQGVLAQVEQEPLAALLQHPGLRLLAPVCQREELIGFQRQLAKRAGLLVQLAAETDPQDCTTLLQPDHLYRFTTEKTRTINTTAVGGNATLLELGGNAP